MYDGPDPIESGEADAAYDLDREMRAEDGRPSYLESCHRCEGWGNEQDEDGMRTCPACGGDGLSAYGRKRRAGR